MRLKFLLMAILFFGTPHAATEWWMNQPIRLVQANLRETDSALDPAKLAAQLVNFRANTLLFGVGGIVAQYPTQVQFHYPSQYLPPGSDLVGEMLREAHGRGIRVIGRFDFSRARRSVYEAHPEWFFRNQEGLPVFDDNGLYSSCINGGYYNQKALEILSEALGRYELDGAFFNWFGNIRTDYKGNDIGLCHCRECSRMFRERYGREIPEEPDSEYSQFMFDSSRRVAREFRNVIKEKRPEALFMTYIQEYTDGIVSEADFYKWRPLPQWVYSSSEHVNRALNTLPEKMAFNLVMPYQEMRYRFASTSGFGLKALLFQSIAHGGFPAFVLLGTFEQPDLTALKAVQPVFEWHSQNESILTGQRNSGRIILYARQGLGWNSHSENYRGFFRLLSELHLPFVVTNRIEGLSPNTTDLIVIPDGEVPREIRDFVELGGRALVAGTTHPGMAAPETVKMWRGTKSSYIRIENHERFPSLKDTWAIFWEGDLLEMEPARDQPLTLIPPSQFGPPEKVSTLSERTQIPGLFWQVFGKGQYACIPWNLGELYYRYSNDKHRLLVSDAIDGLLISGRQLVTNAHPLVEMTLMSHPSGATLIHLINLSGHSGTAFFQPLPQEGIEIQLRGAHSAARTLRSRQPLPITQEPGITRFMLPRLTDYEVVVLE